MPTNTMHIKKMLSTKSNFKNANFYEVLQYSAYSHTFMVQKHFIKKHLKHETTLIMVLNNQDHGIYKEINSHSCFQGESASNLH